MHFYRDKSHPGGASACGGVLFYMCTKRERVGIYYMYIKIQTYPFWVERYKVLKILTVLPNIMSIIRMHKVHVYVVRIKLET